MTDPKAVNRVVYVGPIGVLRLTLGPLSTCISGQAVTLLDPLARPLVSTVLTCEARILREVASLGEKVVSPDCMKKLPIPILNVPHVVSVPLALVLKGSLMVDLC